MQKRKIDCLEFIGSKSKSTWVKSNQDIRECMSKNDINIVWTMTKKGDLMQFWKFATLSSQRVLWNYPCASNLFLSYSSIQETYRGRLVECRDLVVFVLPNFRPFPCAESPETARRLVSGSSRSYQSFLLSPIKASLYTTNYTFSIFTVRFSS